MRKSLSRTSSFGEAPKSGKRRSVFSKLFSKKDALKEAFKKIAGDKHGTLDVDGVRQAITSVGAEPPPFDELPSLLKEHDADADGRITLDEFKDLILHLTGGGGSSSRTSSLADVRVEEKEPSPAAPSGATAAHADAQPPATAAAEPPSNAYSSNYAEAPAPVPPPTEPQVQPTQSTQPPAQPAQPSQPPSAPSTRRASYAVAELSLIHI